MAEFSWRRWVVLVTTAEVVGFAAPVTAMALTASAPPWVGWAVVAIAGGVEGAMLGLGQWLCWHRHLPGLSWTRYVGATAAAAVLAWSIGMLPSTLGPRAAWDRPLVWCAAVVLAAVLLLSIPVAQSLALNGHVSGSHRWAGWTLLAWMVALPWSFAPSPFVDATTPPVQMALGFALGGLAMALTMAALTGVGARRLLRDSRSGTVPAAHYDGDHVVS